MSPKVWLVLGAILAGLSVYAGAYRSHSLERKLIAEWEQSPESERNHDLGVKKQLDNFDIGVRYQMIHAFALIVVGIMAQLAPGRWWLFAGLSFLVGEVLFPGALYGLVFTGDERCKAAVPIGGVLFILGWVCVAAGCLVAKFEPQLPSAT